MMIYYILLFLTLPSYTITHDLHLSRCDINYNMNDGIGEVSITMFLDDIETHFAELEALNLFNSNESLLADSLLLDYINTNVIITHDDKSIVLSYVGKEMSEDLSAGYFYLEFEIAQKPKHVSIKTDILMSLFEDQQNMLTIRNNGKKIFHDLHHRGSRVSELQL